MSLVKTYMFLNGPNRFPQDPCMVYLHTFDWFFRVNPCIIRWHRNTYRNWKFVFTMIFSQGPNSWGPMKHTTDMGAPRSLLDMWMDEFLVKKPIAMVVMNVGFIVILILIYNWGISLLIVLDGYGSKSSLFNPTLLLKHWRTCASSRRCSRKAASCFR